MHIPLKLLRKVINHFNGNINQARIWLDIPNPVLNGMRPTEYCFNASWERLEKMIDDALEETKNES